MTEITISKNSIKRLSTIAAGVLLFLSAFARYDSQWLDSPVLYPPIISELIDLNRPLVGAIIATSLFLLLTIRKKIIIASPYILIFIFHLFLSLKSIYSGSQAWIFGVTGAFIILCVSTVFFHSISNTRKDVLFLFHICTAWVLCGLFIIATQGFSYYTTNERLYLFSAHPNHAGSIWAAATFIMLYVASNKFGRARPTAAILGLICAYFLISTGSRGAMLSLITGIAVFVSLSIQNYRKAPYIIIAGALSTLIYALYNGEMIANFLSYQLDRGNTRSGTYGAALSAFIENPIFGIPIQTTRYLYVENTILASMQLGGLIGLTLILLFYLSTTKKLLKTCTIAKNHKSKIAVFYASLFSISLTQSIFEAYPLNFITSGAFLMIYSIMGMKVTTKHHNTQYQATHTFSTNKKII